MASVLTVTPNTLVDFLAAGEVVPGKVTRTGRFEAVAGGKGLNVARVLRRFGHRVLAAGFAGGFTGALLRERLAADGVEPVLVETKARTRLGFQAISLEGGSTALLESGFAVQPDEARRLVDCVAMRLPEVALVVVGGSVPDGTCDELFVDILRRCARANVPCWIDSYGRALDRALASEHPPALCKPNRQELAQGSGFERCPELHLTDGAEPIEVRVNGRVLRVRPPAVREVTAVGSGDCYLAGLAHATLEGLGLEVRLCYAAAAGAANAARADVAAISLEEVRALLAQVAIEEAG